MPSRAGRWQAAGRPRWPSTWTRQVRQAPRGERSGSLQSCGRAIPRRFTASSTVAPCGTSTAASSTVTCTVAEFIGDPISPECEAYFTRGDGALPLEGGGFRLAVICECGGRFARSVNPHDPDAEQLREALAAFEG